MRLAGVALLLLATVALAGDRDERGWTVAEDAVAAGTAETLSGGGPFRAPDLGATLLSPAAEAADLDTLVTGPTLLFYYSSTCPHCQEVAPELVRLADRLSEKVSVIGIASGSNSFSEIKAFVKESGLNFPNYKDFSRKYSSTNQITSTPTVLLVGPAEGGGFETLAEYRPFQTGFGLIAEIRARVVLGEDPFAAFEEGRYEGPAACGSCHVNEYASWGLTHHSVAYWSLYEREEAENPECIGCHVVGFGEPGGFEIGDHGSPLVDVGCEACHGPAGPHAGERAPVAESRGTCVRCHDDDHSIQFDEAKAVPHIDHFRSVPLDPEQFRVAREDLLAGRAERPLLAFPDGANLGADACQECHPAQVRKHGKSAHGRAIKTLKQKGSQRDVGCLSCHAVAKVTTPKKPADFHPDGVGCEACHGPGEQHVEAKGGTDNIVGLGESCPECVVEAICTRCHTPEHDAEWDLKTALPKVRHAP